MAVSFEQYSPNSKKIEIFNLLLKKLIFSKKWYQLKMAQYEQRIKLNVVFLYIFYI